MRTLLIILLSAFSAGVYAQGLLDPARVIFYNVENLFDTIDDPGTQDEEFLPTGKNNWNTARYQLKLQHLAQVIDSLLDTIQPLVIGLAEVENRRVLEDLLLLPAMKKYPLKIAHHDSPDERGIDVALLVNTEMAEEVFHTVLKVDLGTDKTRDILYYKGFMTEAAPLWIFVNHWPSRGSDKTGALRAKAALVLREKIENVYMGEPNARIIVMGDMNDNYSDSSLLVLTGLQEKTSGQKLLNLMKPLQQKGLFTARYKGQNDLFDQFVVSQNLLDENNDYFIRKSNANIYSPKWLLFNHKQYGLIPNRTFSGGIYTAGYSDHLPVYFDIVFK